MQAIKALVIFMGILIVAGLGLLGYGMYTKAGRAVKPSPAPEAPISAIAPVAPIDGHPAGNAAPAPAVAVSPFGRLALAQPPGTRIVAAEAAGGLLILHLAEGGRPDRVAVVDLAARTVLGTVALEAAEPVPPRP
jgi:hypothetical protein